MQVVCCRLQGTLTSSSNILLHTLWDAYVHCVYVYLVILLRFLPFIVLCKHCVSVISSSYAHKMSGLWHAGLKEVVVTRKAGEAVLRGAPVFAPGVLAMSKHLVEGDTVAVSIAREIPGKVLLGHITSKII